ncbi:discoidin domain-containing protein [Rhizobium sp. 9140]|uniref:discoidin domain-containing protein n=1 Tax=Rhizobium sp. 9140 TaxID=1761900 RepID=UPI00079B49DD|nr:discoidin domain-containing protein [Rhizobium sp. 9140]CZT33307.1 F5/8 type C domain-containing protein [Rhizobium sp. 9140]
MHDSSTFADRPNIEVNTEWYGNLGNRMYQYFAICGLMEHIGPSTISNADFNDWGFSFPKVDRTNYRKHIVIKSAKDFDFDRIKALVAEEPSTFIQIQHHLQRKDFFLDKDLYAKRFKAMDKPEIEIDDDTIVINVRASEILSGEVHWYPLVPVEFYEDIVRATGKKPLFLGQLAPSPYFDRLQQAFPDARFVNSQGAYKDFETVRSAKYIVPATSTFSLAAAWLSDAEQIYLPINGFLNPAHMPDIDLIQDKDKRYRFYLFPMNYALPVDAAMEHYKAIAGSWKEISSAHVRAIRRRPHQMPPVAEVAPLGFSEKKYVHKYLDVALLISNGWYRNGLHHFSDIGRKTGYSIHNSFDEAIEFPNLALQGVPTQSSISPWSSGSSIEEDAKLCVSGDSSKEAGCHTGEDFEPWWAVDCRQNFLLKEVRVFNRKNDDVAIQERARGIAIEWSLDGQTWVEVLQTHELFGVQENSFVPLRFIATENIIARYIRVIVRGKTTILNLAEVEVYGVLDH